MKNLSANQIKAMLKETTGLVSLVAVQISHPDYGDYFLVDNTEDVLLDSQLFTAFPLQFTPDEDTDKSKISCKLRLANPTRTFVEFFRTIKDNLTVTPMLLSVTDNSISPPLCNLEMTLLTLQAENMSENNKYIDLDLVYERTADNRFPYMLYGPYDFPGIF